MKLTLEQKKAVFTCIKDLEFYYQTCGNKTDFKNLEILKVFLNCKIIDVSALEVNAEIVKVSNRKNK